VFLSYGLENFKCKVRYLCFPSFRRLVNLPASTKLFCIVPIKVVIFKFRTIFSHLGITRTKARDRVAGGGAGGAGGAEAPPNNFEKKIKK